MIDDYLKNVNNCLEHKKNVVAAYHKAKTTQTNTYIYLQDVLICITVDQKMVETTIKTQMVHDCKKIDQTKLNELIFELQVVTFLSIGKKNDWPYKWYQKKLCTRWMEIHPHFSLSILIQDAKKLPLKFIHGKFMQDLKHAIYEKQTCHVCNAVSVQMCAVCGITHYCSSQCQKEDWQKHKVTCFIIEL